MTYPVVITFHDEVFRYFGESKPLFCLFLFWRQGDRKYYFINTVIQW